ncbi:MAG: T9SS type A sorting domain-containing protein [Bacteroidota bacterium]
MKKIQLFVLMILSFCCVKTYGQNSDSDIRAKGGEMFRFDQQHAPTDTYTDYIKSHPSQKFSYNRTFISQPSGASNGRYSIKAMSKIIVIADSALYSQLTFSIDRYIQDIQNAYNCNAVFVKVTGGTYQNIKNLILADSTDLDGVVLIGDIPVAWYEIANDYNTYGYAQWPCDLYYMDLNGTWTDSDINSIYDTHTGDVEPEIFVGRISTANMGVLLNEVTGMQNYLDKDHAFWAGNIPINKKFGLSYVDEDWVPYTYFFTDIQYLYGAAYYDSIGQDNAIFGKTDYLSRLDSARYEFIQISSHSDYLTHYLTGGSISSTEIFNLGPKAIGYNLYACSACRWTSTNSSSSSCFMGGAYVYNSSPTSLVAVGSTKTGSLLGFNYLFQPLGNGDCMGVALVNWWQNYIGSYHSNDDVSWFYGISIIGDPMINFLSINPTASIGNNTENVKSCTVYPNPANERITIKTIQKSEIIITDINGKFIQSLSANEGTTTIVVSGLAKGVYFVSIQTDETLTTEKFIKY